MKIPSYRASARPLLLLGLVFSGLSACDDSTDSVVLEPDCSVVSTGNGCLHPEGGVAFRVGSTLSDQVLAECDSVLVKAIFSDGAILEFREALASVLDPSGLLRLAELPRRSCRLEFVFVDKENKVRLRYDVQITLESTETDRATVSDLPEPVVSGRYLTFLPKADAAIKPDQPYNYGLASSMELSSPTAMALVDFGRIDSVLGSRKILRARLLLSGWATGSGSSPVALSVGTTSRGWSEGKGHPYWWGGVGRNGYAEVYRYWPDYTPPATAEEPSLSTGVRGDLHPELFADWKGLQNRDVALSFLLEGAYPARELLTGVDLDVTEVVRSMQTEKTSFAFALRASGVGLGGRVHFLSKESPDPDREGPRLVVELAADQASDHEELRPIADTWIDPDDRNYGLSSEFILWRPGNMALMDFGDIPAAVRGRTIARAELVMRGWHSLQRGIEADEAMVLDYGTIPLGWREGRGFWYWFDGKPQNGFSTYVQNWPDFLPSPTALDPAIKSGIVMSTSAFVSEGFDSLGTLVPGLRRQPSGIYPRIDSLTEVRMDVTEAIKEQAASGVARGFALRRAIRIEKPFLAMGICSKDMAPEVAPVLRIWFTP